MHLSLKKVLESSVNRRCRLSKRASQSFSDDGSETSSLEQSARHISKARNSTNQEGREIAKDMQRLARRSYPDRMLSLWTSCFKG